MEILVFIVSVIISFGVLLGILIDQIKRYKRAVKRNKELDEFIRKQAELEFGYYKEVSNRKVKQHLENIKLEDYVKREAARRIIHNSTGTGIYVSPPEISAIIEYDRETAKYNSSNLEDAIQAEVNRLKSNYT